MEKNLELVLAWLGLGQYYERFNQAGFDSWETLLEITEDDLEILDVDLGHRRKLQKEIKKTRAMAAAEKTQQGYNQQQMPTYLPSNSSFTRTAEPDSFTTDSTVPAKRGYRHHAKPDPNAPRRPYSAYMLFSNHIRTLIADENLDFPEISRQVGQRWQALSAEEKQRWRQEAQGPWGRYKQEVTRYQATKEHAEYQRYLEVFNASQGGMIGRNGGPEGKRRESSNMGSGMYPTPGQTPAGTRKAFSDSYGSMTSLVAPPSGMRTRRLSSSPDAKVPIKRFRRDSAKETTEVGDRKPRSKHACEPCRQKKTKCNEERPTCGHCLELNVECYYSNGKQTKDKRYAELEYYQEGRMLTSVQRDRRFDELSKKLETCQNLLLRVKAQTKSNDQNLIDQALNLPPRLNVRRRSAQQASCVDVRPSSLDDAEFSDDHSPGLGLIEATSHVSDDEFAHEGMETCSRAFAGQSSDVQWMQRLTNELNHEGSGRRQPQQPFPSSLRSNIFAEDHESAVVGNNVDPFQVPIKSIADALVDGYFTTIHASVPVLHRPSFMHQYNNLKIIWHKPVEFEDRVFLTTLQLVFAIGAVHARLSNSVEVSDDRSHLLYFARARILAVDSGVFNDEVHLGQAQVFGLGALYCLVTDQMNRAWIASGLAIRSAQSLGLHLQNITPSISDGDKEYRSRVWFALLSFERTLSVMAGRPSMVQDQDGSLSLPPLGSETPSSSISQCEEPHILPSPKEMNSQTSRAPRNSLSEASQRSFQGGKIPNQSLLSVEATYFKHHVELTTMAHGAVSQLYAPAIRQQRWSKIQALLDGFDDELTTWRTSLEPPFGGPDGDFNLDSRRSPLNIALAIQFHCIRAIINLPCLYRHERTALQQASHVAVSRCVCSARAVIDLVVNSPAAVLLQQSPHWWLLLHHLKRALAVLLLELAFRAEHMPSEAGGLFAEAKKAVKWLHGMAQRSKIAEHDWMTMSCLLVKAARRVGIDAGENGSFDDIQPREGRPQHSAANTPGCRQTPIAGMGSHDLLSSDHEQFGVPLDPSAFENFVPYTSNTFQTSQDQLTFQNVMEPEAFHQLSFDPFTSDQDQVRAAYAPYLSAVVGGQIPHHDASFTMAHGHQSSTMLEGHSSSAKSEHHHELHQHHQQQQQQQQGNGSRADGYPADDWFGFDPSRNS